MAIIAWSVLVLCALYLLQRLVFRYVGLKAVTYNRAFSAVQLFAGQTIWMNETIANRKRLPLPWLRVESLLPAALVFKHQESHMSINRGDQLQNHASLFSIPAYTEIVRKHEVLCPHRGCYKVASYTISLGDIVGVPSLVKTYEATNELVVFPKLVDVRDFPQSAQKLLQSVRSMNNPLMEDHYHVAGVRPYRGGDSFRMINWSATAKSGELLVHKRESMSDNDLMLIVNAELLDPLHNRRIAGETFEQALSYAASAAHYLISGGGKVGLVFNGQVEGSGVMPFRIPVQAGTAHLHRLLHAMAKFEAVTRLGLSFVLEQLVAERKSGVNYMLITAFIEPKQEELIGQLRRGGNTVELLLLSKGVA